MVGKILGLVDVNVTGFRKERVSIYDTIYEVSFVAEPIIRETKDEIETLFSQRFYLIYNPELPANCNMVISDLSIIDCGDEDEYFWEENTNNVVLSDKRMLDIYERILFSLKSFNDSISMFTDLEQWTNELHDEYIYNYVEYDYLEFLLGRYTEESDNAKVLDI